MEEQEVRDIIDQVGRYMKEKLKLVFPGTREELEEICNAVEHSGLGKKLLERGVRGYGKVKERSIEFYTEQLNEGLSQRGYKVQL